MVKRVSKRVSEIVFLIAAGGSTYYLIEIWFRGFSHWTMFVLGGVALTFCSFQGEVCTGLSRCGFRLSGQCFS